MKEFIREYIITVDFFFKVCLTSYYHIRCACLNDLMDRSGKSGTWLGVVLELVLGDPSTCNCPYVLCLCGVEEN